MAKPGHPVFYLHPIFRNFGIMEVIKKETGGNDVKTQLRPIEKEDLPALWNLLYRDPSPEWKKWDAPYFPHVNMSLDEYEASYVADPDRFLEHQRIIECDGVIIGTVSFYWEYEPTRWLEAGIGIYDPRYWNGGYGTDALAQWVEHLFATKDIGRVGITTWSGNERMMRTAEKIGMILEGRMRKCRYHEDVYYDSIRMGITREEWEERS